MLYALDLTVSPPTFTTMTVPDTKLSKLALIASTGPDRLAAGDRGAVPKLHVIEPTMLNGATLLFSAALAAAPVAVAVAPGGDWAYVDESSDNIEIIDLGRLLQNLPVSPPPPFGVGANTEGIAITATGQRLYVPYAGNPNGGDGGVAVFGVSNAVCGAALHEVRPCPDCGAADCLVLATIKGYRPGRRLLDPADPAPAPAADAAAGIARIDNLEGRKLLASTETLQEVLECLLAHGGGGGGTVGPQGPPGAQGPPGQTDQRQGRH